MSAQIHIAQKKERRSGIGLCLSGGGFRAALFHLGAMRRLHEIGILSDVRTVSSVSGGSILAAFLADRIVSHSHPNGLTFDHWEKDIAIPFREFASQDLRTLPILMHILWNWALPQFRARHLERRYTKKLTQMRLIDLPDHPKFIFCATDMTFGVNWVFTKEAVGDYQVGYFPPPSNWSLARAVAASSCFPPVFGPLAIRAPIEEIKQGNYRGKDRRKLLSRLTLSDGGVYDNLGNEPVWKDHEYILISDGGAPFEFNTSRTPIRRLLRYTSIITNQASALRKRSLFAGITDKKYKGAYWGIKSSMRRRKLSETKGYSEELIADVISKIRTDLDAFTMEEMFILENHGYYAAENAIRRRLPEWINAHTPMASFPHPELADDRKVRKALKSSHKRFSLRRFLLRKWCAFISIK